MSATDYLTIAGQKIYNLLFIDTPSPNAVALIVKPGNRISLLQGKENPFKMTSLMPGDLPQVTIAFGEFSDSQYYDDPTYGYTESTNPVATAWLDSIRQTYLVTTVFEDLNQVAANELILEMMTALRLGGPTLQLASVREWGPVTGDWSYNPDADNTDVIRLVHRMKVPVWFELQGNQNLS